MTEPREIKLTPAQRWQYQRNRGRRALERIDEYNARVRHYKRTGRAPAPAIRRLGDDS